MSRTPRRIALFVAAVLISIFLWAAPARAQNGTWTWTGASTTSQSWADDNNWSPANRPPNDGTANLVFNGNSTHFNPTHRAWSIHSLVFAASPAAGPYDILGDGPLTFARDPANQFYPQPLIANDSSKPNAVRGDFVIPADVQLQARVPNGTLTLGNATGSRLNGGGGSRGGTLVLNSSVDRLVFMLDNAATSAADRGLHLAATAAYTQDFEPADQPVYQPHLTIVAADANYTGTGSSIDVTNLAGNIQLKFQPDGANRNSVGFAPTQGGVTVHGDERAAGVARAGAEAPRVVFNGLTQGGLATFGNVTLTGGGDDPLYAVDGFVGSAVRVTGTTTFGSAHPDATRTLRIGEDIEVIPFPAASSAVFDPTLGASGDVTNRKTEYAGTVTLRGDFNEPASLVFRSSAHVTSGPTMTFDGVIAGGGIVRLEDGSADIAFSPTTRITPGRNGAAGALRFEGTGPNLANFATPQRLRSITGRGTVEFRRTDNQPFDLAGNVWSDPAVWLKVTDSNPTGLDARLNAAGGTNFAGRVELDRGATIDVAGNRIAGADGFGTLVGPAAYGNLTPGVAGDAGTLTITGDSTGLASLFIRTSLDRGPQAYGQLHATDDLTLVSADGAATRLSTTSPGGGTFGQQLTIVSLDAGATLTGQFDGLPDGATIKSFQSYDYIIHYNVDGGDGSANDVTLTLVPEPGACLCLAVGALGLLRRRRLNRA
jgi:hypothetical protein